MFCLVQAEACKSVEYVMCSVLYRRKRVSRWSTLYVSCVVQAEACKSVEYVMCPVLYRRKRVSRWNTLCVLCSTGGGV